MVKVRAKFACPGLQKYPLNTRARISSAKAYYPRSGTAKCEGGKMRICRAAERAGFMDRPGWKKWCK
jgi:hypothetical protein